MSAFSLRPATPDDLPTLLEVEARSHLAPWNEAHFRAELDKPYSHLLVLTDDETDSQLIGYIVFWILSGECQILNVVVDLPYRGLGHAKQMIRRAVTLASREGARRAILDVRKGNGPAVQLYQSTGFTISRVQKGFYSNGEDAYQMTLDFEGEGEDRLGGIDFKGDF